MFKGRKALLCEIEQLKKENYDLEVDVKKFCAENESLRTELNKLRYAKEKFNMVKCRAKLADLYDEAHKRQKTADAKPSEYMKGLRCAINILNEYIGGLVNAD